MIDEVGTFNAWTWSLGHGKRVEIFSFEKEWVEEKRHQSRADLHMPSTSSVLLAQACATRCRAPAETLLECGSWDVEFMVVFNEFSR